jgi:hypothetical protein
MEPKILVYLISIIMFTTILSTRVFGEAICNYYTENCCDGLDNDGDGAVDAADSDCGGRTITLSSGTNTVCWATPSPYPNYADYTSHQYSCPSGQIVTTIGLSGKTELGYDFIKIYDAQGREITRRSGDITSVDVSSANTQSVTFKFTSDYSNTDRGVKVESITCTATQQCPAGTTPAGVSECTGAGGTCVQSHPLGCCCRYPSPTPSAENCCDGVDVTQAE